ncbi:MAG: permease [Planctomycetota bacterium]
MIDWVLEACVGGFIRFIEGGISCAPTLLVGLLISAVFRYYLGSDGTRRLFGGDSLRSLPQSWAVGMLLPVCSIGVLPILFEMRRAKIKPGAMSAFALSAPLFNPLSLLYGLTLARPYVILFFAFGSLLVVTLVGLFWDRRVAKNPEDFAAPDQENECRVIGTTRLFAVFVHITRELTGRAGGWALVGLTGLVLLAVVLPWGAFQGEVNRDDWMAPLKMSGVALPAYATPMLAMSQLGMMFQHANSPGAAFVLLVLGTGVNVATVVWFGRTFSLRASAYWIGSLFLIVVGIAYVINKPLFPPGVEPFGHTHAFDIYTSPVHNLDTLSLSYVQKKIEKDIDIGEVFALIAGGVLLLAGFVVRGFNIDESMLERWSGSAGSQQLEVGSFDRIVGPQIVGATMIVGLIALSVVMCYAFYPSTEESLEEIRIARAETLSAANSGDVEHAMFWIPIWDEWSRRLEVGTLIRRGELRPYQRMQGYLVRKKLEALEHELAHEPLDLEATQELVADLLITDQRWVRSYRE